MNENFKFDTVRAKQWKNNVDTELEQVSSLLDRVTDLCITVPGEDDTIIKTIVKVAEAEEKAWTRLKDAFKTISQETDNVINRINQGIIDSVDKVQNMLDKFGL